MRSWFQGVNVNYLVSCEGVSGSQGPVGAFVFVCLALGNAISDRRAQEMFSRNGRKWR